MRCRRRSSATRSPCPKGAPLSHAAEPSAHVTIVAANPFEFDSRFLRTATSLAADGHRLRILGWSAPGLPAEEELAPGVRLTRLDVDRRISSGAAAPAARLRRPMSRLIGLDPDARVLPPDAPRGLDRLRHPVRRLLEVVANARRAGPWADVVRGGRAGDRRLPRPVARGAARRARAPRAASEGASCTTWPTITPRPPAWRACPGSSASWCVAASATGRGTPRPSWP